MTPRIAAAFLLVAACSAAHAPPADSAAAAKPVATAAAPPTDSAQDDAHRVGLTFVGYPHPPQFKWLGGKPFTRDSVRYSLFAVGAANRVEVWLATVPDTTGASQGKAN